MTVDIQNTKVKASLLETIDSWGLEKSAPKPQKDHRSFNKTITLEDLKIYIHNEKDPETLGFLQKIVNEQVQRMINEKKTSEALMEKRKSFINNIKF